MSALPVRRGGRPQRALLVGFQDQDNLGLRYLCSAVRAAGHEPEILTFDKDPADLIKRAKETDADLIGLSLIFQYMTPSFGEVIAALREAGITAHIAVGGHYPSFAPKRLLDGIPGLDTVVRFDGEVTLAELLNCMAVGADWRGIDGIACRSESGGAQVNKLRATVDDLDILPWPERTDIDYESNPLATASVLGSRGCPWDCSFCSIRPFYELQGGKLRRLRAPEAVAEEMLYLHQKRDVPLFLFQDDDFLATGRRARRWGTEIADHIMAAGAAGSLAFKMSCRSDEIDYDTLAHLMQGGLTHVYLGVESGDIDGLANMSKKLKPEAHLRAGETLKSLGLSFDFGFMLMDPSSTFQSIRNNIAFLDSFVGDGWSVATFCRMLPYAGTPVRRELEEAGRLKGTEFQPDYAFLDPKLDLYYDWMIRTFHQRNFTTEGLCHALRYLMFEARLQLLPDSAERQRRTSVLKYLTAQANQIAFRVLRLGLDHIERTPIEQLRPDDEILSTLTQWEASEEETLMRQVQDYMTETAGEAARGIGGFDRSWTHAARSRETAGIGAV